MKQREEILKEYYDSVKNMAEVAGVELDENLFKSRLESQHEVTQEVSQDAQHKVTEESSQEKDNTSGESLDDKEKNSSEEASKKRTLVEDSADPNLEQPSYMDPED
jgi:hypothetical protein